MKGLRDIIKEELKGILKEAVKYFDNNYDVEIFEAHHRDKLDAPSGTALKMGSIIADTLGLNPEDSFCFSSMNEFLSSTT